jgi:hydroxyacylglutathione hydrolase
VSTDTVCRFFERPYPSANAVLLLGPKPILVDPGFGSDVADLHRLLATAVTPAVHAEDLAMVINTHYHSDHVGGNHALQSAHGLQIAAHAHEAAMVNRRDPNACAAEWLRQPVESYTVAISLSDGDVVDTGSARWHVVHTPGHTAGHISLFEPTSGVLVAGDTVHASDVGWLNPALEGADSLLRSLDSLARIEALRPRLAFSGHGTAMTEPMAAIKAARARLSRWLTDSEAAAWHAAKRILAFALMIEGGIAADELHSYFADSPWARDIATHILATPVDAFRESLVDQMLKAGGISWRNDRLVANTPHTPTDPSWPLSPTRPSDW